MAKDILIKYKQPTINKNKIPEVFQYCDKCKNESIHKKDGIKKILSCIKCDNNFKYK
jgi:acetyl-CoA carboxylase beta subunit